MLSNVEAKCVLWVPVYNEPESKTVTVWKKERKVPSVTLIIGPLQNCHVPYRICWLASLRTRSTSLPLCSSSLVRVSMVSFREWISWSRSVMRLLREHTSACRSEIRASSSCSCTHGEPDGLAVKQEHAVRSRKHTVRIGYLLVAVLHGALQLTFGSRVLFQVDLLEMLDRRSMKVVEFCTERRCKRESGNGSARRYTALLSTLHNELHHTLNLHLHLLMGISWLLKWLENGPCCSR